MKTLLVKPFCLVLSLLLLINACVPIMQTQYTSPTWQGVLVDMQTGAPLVDVEVIDLHTLKKVKTNRQGYFQLPANTIKFSLKMPVATMVRNYQIEVVLPQGPLRFNGTRMVNTLAPSNFDLGYFPIDNATTSAAFLLEDNGQMRLLPEYFIQSCQAPLKDAIRLTKAARFFKQLADNSKSLGVKKISRKDIETSYGWANKSWQQISDVCFKGEYEQLVAFNEFSDLFYQEAIPYLKETAHFAED